MIKILLIFSLLSYHPLLMSPVNLIFHLYITRIAKWCTLFAFSAYLLFNHKVKSVEVVRNWKLTHALELIWTHLKQLS